VNCFGFAELAKKVRFRLYLWHIGHNFSYLDNHFGKGSYVAIKGFAQPFDFYLADEKDSIYIDTYEPYELQDLNTLLYYKVYQIV